uniref:Peptidase M14 domain-containing protein n=4 Tax=Physcomitrium patens TaxID=3218 RepID=A0A2K1IVG8_PHYPA|nr:carboxypeptidase A2-like isoform X1 [Physcomitrium patens]XP_024358405.1 carboxypeptidase A2-like isoform X1 [Physcomitrium patens]XP_024358406.1 carboxypeptidase A2-like isoform X1 [Physcomitrium patens]PNR33271.1 hypothetical protein PHYPA_025214 [Physcomitrium patens]|eukprot:XP_024358404.1 carboxypeptidase A2-like isoform X1 [Physcomitrella patens]
MTCMCSLFLLAIVALTCKMCQGKLESNPTYTRANITMPDYQIYHRMDELLGEVDALVDRHPGIMRRDMMEATVDGYSTKMSVVSVSPGGFDGKLDEKLRILLNFGEHARELVTSELALRLLSMLGGEHNLTVDNRTRLAHILPHTVMKIIPMENVNGRVKVEAGDLCERKNGRGVDTNRNWKVDWGKKEKDYNPNEEYPGTAPFSEPETRILHQLVKEFAPQVWVNVHSGMEALFMPYDHKKMVPNDSGGVAVRNLLQVLNEQHCQGRCAVGSGGAFVGYLSHGTATDYIYDVAKVPIALTLEIFGDEKTPDEDCFRMFNPVSYNQLEEVLAKWSTIFFALLVNLPKTLSSMPSTIAATSWDISESSSLRPLKQFEYLYNGSGELKKLGRVWHGMDTVSEGLRTPDTEASLQYYLLFCLMLLIMSWFRCSRRYKRLFFYIRSVSRR